MRSAGGTGPKVSYVWSTGNKSAPAVTVSLAPIAGDRYAVTVGERTFEVEAWPVEGGVSMRREGRSIDLRVDRKEDRSRVSGRGCRAELDIVGERTWKLRQALGHGSGSAQPNVRSPMAGRIVLAKVAVGDSVESGQTLVIIEAMKMENEIRATAPARVKAVRVQAGQIVAAGDVLVDFDVEPV